MRLQHLKKTDYSEYTEARAKFAGPKVPGAGGGGGDRSSVIFRVPGRTAEFFDSFPEPSGDNQKVAMISYGTQAKFWETVLNKKQY